MLFTYIITCIKFIINLVENLKPMFYNIIGKHSDSLFEILDLIVPESRELYHRALWNIMKIRSLIKSKFFKKKKSSNTFLKYFGDYSLLIDSGIINCIEKDEVTYIIKIIEPLVSLHISTPLKGLVVNYEYVHKSKDIYGFLIYKNDLFQIYIINMLTFGILSKYTNCDVQLRVYVKFSIAKENILEDIHFSKGTIVYSYSYLKNRESIEDFFIQFDSTISEKYGDVSNIRGFSISLNQVI